MIVDVMECKEQEWVVWRDAEDQLYRSNGLTMERSDSTKYCTLNGQIHKEDGPAIEYVDGSKKWFLFGKELTEEEFNDRQKQVV